jgi:hypothetical protein
MGHPAKNIINTRNRTTGKNLFLLRFPHLCRIFQAGKTHPRAVLDRNDDGVIGPIGETVKFFYVQKSLRPYAGLEGQKLCRQTAARHRVCVLALF